MTPDEHTDKARVMLRSMQKLRPSDYEMRIEAAMLVGTHLMNMELHRLGVTSFDTDALHAEYLTGAQRVKADLLAPGLVDLLYELEMLRPTYVRGDWPGGESAASRAIALLEALQNRVVCHGSPSARTEATPESDPVTD